MEHISQPYSCRRWIEVQLSHNDQKAVFTDMKTQKFATRNENEVNIISWKSDVALFWHFLTHTGWMDAQRHKSKCCSLRPHSREVANKHQKLSERKIKSRNWNITRQCETPYEGTDTANVDFRNLKLSHILRTAWILAHVIIKFLVRWRNFWRLKVFFTDEEVKKWSRNRCYKLWWNFERHNV